MAAAALEPDLTYFNLAISGTPSTTRAIKTDALQAVTRSGNIVDDASEYYLSAARLRFSLNIPICIAPINETIFPADGLSTAWSFTVRHTNAGGTEFFGRAYIKLQKLPSQIVLGQTQQPLDLYASFSSLTSWRDALTEALEDAYAACNVAAGGTLSAQAPFFSLLNPGTAKLQLTTGVWSLWDQKQRAPGAAFNDLFFNWSAVPAMGGWEYDQVTPTGMPLDVNGADYRFRMNSDGTNYVPANAPPANSLTPTNAGAVLIIPQISPCYTLPGINRVTLHSTLSAIPEGVPSENNAKTELLLLDFAPDLSKQLLGDNRTFFLYNSAIGNARWLQLVGSAPIRSFTVSLRIEDWLGTSRPFELHGPAEQVSLKLCLAPKRLVELSRSTR